MLNQAKDLAARIDADRLMSTTATIAQWERLSGSDDERKAFDYIQSELESLGYHCERHHPVCLVSIPISASLYLDGRSEPIPCISHSFSTSTPPEGVELELIYAHKGTADDYRQINASGKAVLIEGLATPNTVAPAEAFGVGAVIHNSGPQLHEMTISPVWGSPTPNSMAMLPTIPHISVDDDGAAELQAAIEHGDTKVRIVTEVETEWKPLPVLIADLLPINSPTMHVLLSGHVDSWYFGAMDNASANAAMLETARIIVDHKNELRNGLRLAFWSGHSHARYATSAWYADEFWSHLHYYCIAHVNIDSPGGIGATDLTAASTMAESYPVAQEIFREIEGAELQYDRIGRLGDQSFWGAGVPSLYCSISQQPPEESPTGPGALLGKGGGLGWWWHTPDDTMDKLDADFLARDTRLLLATVFALCTAARNPFDQTRAAREIRDTLVELQDVAGTDLDLSESIQLAENLESVSRQFTEQSFDDSVEDEIIAMYNGCITGVSRILIPVNYTVAGQFDHDPAIPAAPLPGLQPMRSLPERRAVPNSYYPWLTRLRRERNRVNQALNEATTLIVQTLAVLEMDDDW